MAQRLTLGQPDAATGTRVAWTGCSITGRREVAAVVYLVSMAVPGLSKDRVSVVSTEGLTLHRPNSDASGGGGTEPLNVLRRAQWRLDPVVSSAADRSPEERAGSALAVAGAGYSLR